MRHNNSIIVHDVREYIYCLRELLEPIMETYVYTGVSTDEVAKWILIEQIERIFALFFEGHYHRHPQYSDIYYHLRNLTNGDIDKLTTYHLFFPRNYHSESIARMRLVGTDLFIWYTKQGPRYDRT